MPFSLTNTGKAKDILKKGNFNVSEMEKGNADMFILDEKQVKKIISGDKNNALQILNSAAKLLKDSLFTRSTGHKRNDFSSIQAASSLRLAKLYSDCKNEIKNQNGAKNSWETLDETAKNNIRKNVTKKIKDIYKELQKIYTEIKNDNELHQRMDNFMKCDKSEQIKRIKNTLSTLHHWGLGKYIILSDKQNHEKGNKIFNEEVSNALGMAGAIPTASTMLGVIYLILGAADSTLLVAGIPFFGIGLPMAALVTTIGIILYHKSDSLGAIANKRKIIKLQQHYEKAIKKSNDLEDYIETQVSSVDKKTSDEMQISDNIKKLIEMFLKQQKDDWGHYTTADKRAYNKSEKDSKNKKHTSGLIYVSDEKTSKIGKLKQGIANQWTRIKMI